MELLEIDFFGIVPLALSEPMFSLSHLNLSLNFYWNFYLEYAALSFSKLFYFDDFFIFKMWYSLELFRPFFVFATFLERLETVWQWRIVHCTRRDTEGVDC